LPKLRFLAIVITENGRGYEKLHLILYKYAINLYNYYIFLETLLKYSDIFALKFITICERLIIDSMDKYIVLILLIILIITFYCGPVAITVFNVINLFKKKPVFEKRIDTLTFLLGIPLALILFAVWKAKDYKESIVLDPSTFRLHTPISYEHGLTFIVFACVAVVGYLILRVKKDKLPPLICILCICSIYLGIDLSILFIIQMSKNFLSDQTIAPFDVVYLSLLPFNYILCSVRLLRQIVNIHSKNQEENEIVYKNRFLNFCQRVLTESRNWYVAAFVMLIPLLGIMIIILVLFGQSPDSIIKAFTETSDWTLSQKVSPPPIEYNGHYLCTVALNGHNKLVKPTRMGIRHGVKIVVNRQLCIANAFEQLIQAKTPAIHRFIRYIYDKYGYPVSKHIKTSWSADFVYVLMKPLEWFFLLILYIVDVKPENRIAMQYTGKKANCIR